MAGLRQAGVRGRAREYSVALDCLHMHNEPAWKHQTSYIREITCSWARRQHSAECLVLPRTRTNNRHQTIDCIEHDKSMTRTHRHLSQQRAALASRRDSKGQAHSLFPRLQLPVDLEEWDIWSAAQALQQSQLVDLTAWAASPSAPSPLLLSGLASARIRNLCWSHASEHSTAAKLNQTAGVSPSRGIMVRLALGSWLQSWLGPAHGSVWKLQYPDNSGQATPSKHAHLDTVFVSELRREVSMFEGGAGLAICPRNVTVLDLAVLASAGQLREQLKACQADWGSVPQSEY